MMIVIDVIYNEEESTAKAVGVLFHWLDNQPQQVITKNIKNIEEYLQKRIILYQRNNERSKPT